jgi:hypothetical protein
VEKDIRTPPVCEPLAPALKKAERLAALRSKYAGKLPYMAHVPAFRFGTPNIITRCTARRPVCWSDPHNRVLADHFPGGSNQVMVSLLTRTPDGAIQTHASEHGADVRTACHAAWRELRLAKHDKAILLRQNAELRAHLDIQCDFNTDMLMKYISLQECKRLDGKTAREQRQRALLAARRRDMTIRRLKAELTAARAQLPEPAWHDAHTLAYLRKGWPCLTPERQEEIAVRLLNEVVAEPRQRNNAWLAIVRAVQSASETAAGVQ